MNHKNRVYLAGIVFVFLATCMACGLKAPPEPPDRVRLPRVEQLTLEQEGRRVMLTWTLEKAGTKALRDLSGFQVLRARREPPPAGCQNCPLFFELVGDVEYMSGRTLPDKWYFQDDPDEGFINYYKVRAYSGEQTFGPESKLVHTGAKEIGNPPEARD